MLNQRWNGGRASYRPQGESIRTNEYDVVELFDDRTPKRFVEEHHYSHSYPAARFRFGLFHRGELAGVAVFSVPCNDRVLTTVFPGNPLDSVELGRFILVDSVPANGETWFLARSFRLLRQHGLAGVVSFSDPEPRRSVDGRIIFPGHIGTIYQAHNGIYLGRGTPRSLRILPDGCVLSDRALQKIRGREQGWRYAAARLEVFGAETLGEHADPLAWLDVWLPQLTRCVRHRGNHKYAWALDRRMTRFMPRSRPYPKFFGIAA